MGNWQALLFVTVPVSPVINIQSLQAHGVVAPATADGTNVTRYQSRSRKTIDKIQLNGLADVNNCCGTIKRAVTRAT
jgi:hypothetical protein